MKPAKANDQHTPIEQRRSVFDIADELRRAVDDAYDNDGELPFSFEQMVGEFRDKVEGWQYVYGEEMAAVERLKSYRDELNHHIGKRIARYQRSSDKLANDLQAALVLSKQDKVKTTLGTAGFRNYDHVEVTPNFVMTAPLEYVRRGDDVPDKAAIKAALSAGKAIEGARLVTESKFNIGVGRQRIAAPQLYAPAPLELPEDGEP